MGRSIKKGLSYFPMDVDFFDDEKLMFVSARFGFKGEAITTRLLCRIYRQGYFLEFNDDVALLFARSAGDNNASGLVKEVVNELLKRGFFDKTIFERFSILTSKGIQDRYLKICKDAKRKDYEIEAKFDCTISENSKTPEKNVKTLEEIVIIPESIQQRKEKKRKEEKSKEEKSKEEKRKLFKPPSLKNVQDYILEKKYNAVRAEIFINFYKSKNWMVGNSKMKDWKAAISGWEARNKKDNPKKNNGEKLNFVNPNRK